MMVIIIRKKRQRRRTYSSEVPFSHLRPLSQKNTNIAKYIFSEFWQTLVEASWPQMQINTAPPFSVLPNTPTTCMPLLIKKKKNTEMVVQQAELSELSGNLFDSQVTMSLFPPCVGSFGFFFFFWCLQTLKSFIWADILLRVSGMWGELKNHCPLLYWKFQDLIGRLLSQGQEWMKLWEKYVHCWHSCVCERDLV